MFLSPFSIAPFGFVQCKWPGLIEQVSLFSRLWHVSRVLPQALVSFKKYMPPPLPYFKVNICRFPLPHFASIFFAYLWSFRWPNYIVTLPRYFSFRLPHLNIPTLFVFISFCLSFFVSFCICVCLYWLQLFSRFYQK